MHEGARYLQYLQYIYTVSEYSQVLLGDTASPVSASELERPPCKVSCDWWRLVT